MSWNFTDPASRGNIDRVWRAQARGLLELAADPLSWEAPTAAGHWQVRDVIGHLVDTTEEYFHSFAAARGRAIAGAPLGLRDMAELVDESARDLRAVPRPELLDRLRADLHRMLALADDLTDEEWTTLMVPHKFMGPIPASFYPIFQIVDYAVHAWDVRQGSGRCHGMDGEAADLLVPACLVLWQYTCDLTGVPPFTVGIRITAGHNAGAYLATVDGGAMAFATADADDPADVIEFDPASFVLTAYGRVNAGTYRGDRQKLDRFCNLFFRI